MKTITAAYTKFLTVLRHGHHPDDPSTAKLTVR